MDCQISDAMTEIRTKSYSHGAVNSAIGALDSPEYVANSLNQSFDPAMNMAFHNGK
jgi:hypothetical protein